MCCLAHLWDAGDDTCRRIPESLQDVLICRHRLGVGGRRYFCAGMEGARVLEEQTEHAPLSLENVLVSL